MAFAQTVQMSAGVTLAMGSRSDVDDAQVHAEPVLRYGGRGLRHVHHYGQVEGAAAIDEVGLPTKALEPSFLIPAEHYGDNLSALERQDGHPVKALTGQNPLIVDDGSALPEEQFHRPVPHTGFRGLADNTECHVSEQTEPSPDFLADKLLEPNLVGRPLPEGGVGNGVAGSLELLHGFKERSRPLGVGWILTRGESRPFSL
jgi:hypothetical protein